ncbi:MAG TPA: membrane protein insertase YidC [Trueperaceae bacterium]|nr:membrane protein insertase YidC [Trueperaceae bacterium]
MKLARATLALFAALLLSLASVAGARVVFEASAFPTSQFRSLDEALANCESEPAPFLCRYQDDELTLIPTKGADFFFTPAGEMAAAFVKVQRGQTLNDYSLNARNNLVPMDATVPAGALLIDGEYLPPTNASGTWVQQDEFIFKGTFEYLAGDYQVERTVLVSNVSETTEQTVTVTAPEGVNQDVLLQFVVPGIARTANPVVKIGHDQTFALNPGERVFENPTYAALQKNDNNRDEALVMLPSETGDELAAAYLRPNLISLQTTLAAGEEQATIAVDLYAGRNELVRYTQEGYLELPGLFRPNILGRLSLLIVQLLQFIHQYVPSWGLSIIVLTLLFRVVVWPLISTQTRSMFGMQQLQPKIKELQRKHKDDREKLTQETMKLYREAGVNPAGGCLPILLQMPLFIILWRVFVNFEFAEGFLWLPDLGQSDPYYILPILYVAVMVATSYFSARGNPQMLRQSMIINVVFVFVIVNFPSGVLVYYVVSMLVQVFQYWLISRGQPAPVRATPALAGKRGK